MKCPHAVIFDLDNTLSKSFEPPAPDVADRLRKLLEFLPVAIMSGASLDRIEKDLLPSLPNESRTRLYLFTDTAAQCFVWKDGKWQSLYKNVFTKDEVATIIRLVKEGLEETSIINGASVFGDQFLARDTQVTFSAIGTYAPAEEKAVWDPSGIKRDKLIAFLNPRLTEFNSMKGGRTAIDITRKGIDKAYGVRGLAKHFKCEARDMIFVGDELRPGRNDACVIPTGIQTIEVAGPHETAKVIDEILSSCSRA